MGRLLVLACGILTLFVGCANSSGGSGGASSTNKELFSVWNRDDSAVLLNLETETLGTYAITWTFPAGEVCASRIALSSLNDSGTYTITNSTYISGTGSGANPNCNLLDQVGTYVKEGTHLSLCENGSSCWEYE